MVEVDQIVDWMRERGILRYRKGDLELTLDPNWQPPIVESEESEEQRRKREALRGFRHVRVR